MGWNPQISERLFHWGCYTPSAMGVRSKAVLEVQVTSLLLFYHSAYYVSFNENKRKIFRNLLEFMRNQKESHLVNYILAFPPQW